MREISFSEAIREATDPSSLELKKVDLRPRKSDIAIDRLALVSPGGLGRQVALGMRLASFPVLGRCGWTQTGHSTRFPPPAARARPPAVGLP